ncbi:hypothetical protein [Ulvibacter antarcticus]|uniref:Uncharacterized protein n=1 Tax=Ulvibacter antarcticus TaxID=442714 RepID=A0A3L9ZLS8_9FLAO|nr:hypothetical protein [Ulvibacter antarcticus]RMA67702.1 hypothetical protein BXY75_0012 [Ulvibacter antarcticus]
MKKSKETTDKDNQFILEVLKNTKSDQLESPPYPDVDSNTTDLEKEDKSDILEYEQINKGIIFLKKLSTKQRERLLGLLKKVQEIQTSELSKTEKTTEIKKVLWTDQSPRSKLFIGGFLGTIVGLMIFGTGGIGIAGLGGAIGVWGFLAGTTGGILISSIIQNFEKNNKE